MWKTKNEWKCYHELFLCIPDYFYKNTLQSDFQPPIKKKYSHCWCLTFQVKLIFIRYWSAAVIEGSLQLFQPKHVYFSFFKHIVDDRVLYCKTEADRFTINIKNCIILPIISYPFAEGDE